MQELCTTNIVMYEVCALHVIMYECCKAVEHPGVSIKHREDSKCGIFVENKLEFLLDPRLARMVITDGTVVLTRHR